MMATRVLSRKEVEQIIGGANSLRDKLIITTLYMTGLRVAELATLKWENFRADETTVSFWIHGKGDKIRTILVSAQFYLDLLKLRPSDSIDTDYIFRSTHEPYLGVKPGQIWNIVKKAATNGGVRVKSRKSQVSYHWLRHSHSVHSVKGGVPIYVLRDTLGHASLATTSRYLNVVNDDSSFNYLKAPKG